MLHPRGGRPWLEAASNAHSNPNPNPKRSPNPSPNCGSGRERGAVGPGCASHYSASCCRHACCSNPSPSPNQNPDANPNLALPLTPTPTPNPNPIFTPTPHPIFTPNPNQAFLLLLAADTKLLELWYEEGALLRSEDCTCAAATALSALQAFDFSALQPSSGLLDMDNPFASPRTESFVDDDKFR